MRKFQSSNPLPTSVVDTSFPDDLPPFRLIVPMGGSTQHGSTHCRNGRTGFKKRRRKTSGAGQLNDFECWRESRFLAQDHETNCVEGGL